MIWSFWNYSHESLLIFWAKFANNCAVSKEDSIKTQVSKIIYPKLFLKLLHLKLFYPPKEYASKTVVVAAVSFFMSLNFSVFSFTWFQALCFFPYKGEYTSIEMFTLRKNYPIRNLLAVFLGTFWALCGYNSA